MPVTTPLNLNANAIDKPEVPDLAAVRKHLVA